MENRLKGRELKNVLDATAAIKLCYFCIMVSACLSPSMLLSQKYWFGQKVHSDFSIRC